MTDRDVLGTNGHSVDIVRARVSGFSLGAGPNF